MVKKQRNAGIKFLNSLWGHSGDPQQPDYLPSTSNQLQERAKSDCGKVKTLDERQHCVFIDVLHAAPLISDQTNSFGVKLWLEAEYIGRISEIQIVSKVNIHSSFKNMNFR